MKILENKISVLENEIEFEIELNEIEQKYFCSTLKKDLSEYKNTFCLSLCNNIIELNAISERENYTEVFFIPLNSRDIKIFKKLIDETTKETDFNIEWVF